MKYCFISGNKILHFLVNFYEIHENIDEMHIFSQNSIEFSFDFSERLQI